MLLYASMDHLHITHQLILNNCVQNANRGIKYIYQIKLYSQKIHNANKFSENEEEKKQQKENLNGKHYNPS
jgi:hypothetical protein